MFVDYSAHAVRVTLTLTIRGQSGTAYLCGTSRKVYKWLASCWNFSLGTLGTGRLGIRKKILEYSLYSLKTASYKCTHPQWPVYHRHTHTSTQLTVDFLLGVHDLCNGPSCSKVYYDIITALTLGHVCNSVFILKVSACGCASVFREYVVKQISNKKINKSIQIKYK